MFIVFICVPLCSLFTVPTVLLSDICHSDPGLRLLGFLEEESYYMYDQHNRFFLKRRVKVKQYEQQIAATCYATKKKKSVVAPFFPSRGYLFEVHGIHVIAEAYG